MKFEFNNEQLEEIRIALYNMGLDLQEMKAGNDNFDEYEKLEETEKIIAEILNILKNPEWDPTEKELPFM